MLNSKTLNNEINHIHKRALRTVYYDYKSFFNVLFDKNGSFTNYQINVQSLAIKIYKYLCSFFTTILGEVFKVKENIPYDLKCVMNYIPEY